MLRGKFRFLSIAWIAKISLSLTVILSLVSCGVTRKKEVANIDYQKASKTNVQLGLAYLGQGQISRAKKKLLHALELDPNSAKAHGAMGTFFEATGDKPKAASEYMQAISLSHGDGEYYNQYGSFLCRSGDFVQADEAYRLAVKDKDFVRTAEVYENAGVCALQLPNLQKAREYFEVATKQDPGRTLSLEELGAIYVSQGDVRSAAIVLSRLNSTSPSSRSLWLEIQTARKLGNKAIELKQAKLLRENFSNTHEYKSYVASKG